MTHLGLEARESFTLKIIPWEKSGSEARRGSCRERMRAVVHRGVNMHRHLGIGKESAVLGVSYVLENM